MLLRIFFNKGVKKQFMPAEKTVCFGFELGLFWVCLALYWVCFGIILALIGFELALIGFNWL